MPRDAHSRLALGRFTPDFGKTAEDYRKHRAGFPASLFDRLAHGPPAASRAGDAK